MPDVLNQIFYDIIWSYYAENEEGSPYQWMNLMLVCRKWRQVMLEYHRLSTIICLDRPAIARKLMARCGAMPITVYTKGYPSEQSLSFFAENIEMFFEADVIVPSGGSLSAALSTAKRQASSLHSLTVRPEQSINPAENTAPLFRTVEFPRLARLRCVGADLRSCTKILTPTLRHLRLDDTVKFRGDVLLNFLRSLGQLEELVLCHTCETPPKDDQLNLVPRSSRSVVTLPRLRIISVKEKDLPCICDILNHIAYPADAFLTLTFPHGLAAPSGALLYPIVSHKLRGEGTVGPVPPITRLCITAGFIFPNDLKFNVQVNAWGTKFPTSGESSARPTEIPLFELNLWGGLRADSLQHLLSELDSSNLRLVQLREIGYQHEWVWPWAAIGPLLSAAIEAQLEYETWAGYNILLKDDLVTPTEDLSPFHGIFPSLQVLMMHEKRYRSRAEGVPVYVKSSALGLPILVKALADRKAYVDHKVEVRREVLKYPSIEYKFPHPL